jgi:hypothetical protein
MIDRELSRKAMTLGNKLARKEAGLKRHEAFVKAWAIIKAGSLVLAVKGVTFGSRQEALRRLSGYNPADVRAFIVPEPENPTDKNALAIMVGVNGGRGLYRLGYVPRNLTGEARAFLGKMPKLQVIISQIYGARITIAA